MTVSKLVSIADYTTKSGKPLMIGTGSGTKWQWAKKGRPEEEQGTIHQELVDQLVLAINLGFTHLDSAETYSTSPEVGAAIKQSGVKREDLWVTSKYATGFYDHQAESAGPLDALDKVLKELDTDYLDLWLIHSPFFEDYISRGQTIKSAWAEMIEAKKSGKVRYIGVSNFAAPHIEECMEVAKGDYEYFPKFNQIECHPYLQDQTKDIQKFCRENGIIVEAYSPLAPLFRVKQDGEEVTDHPMVELLPKLAAKYGKTDSQILLRYTLQKGILPITTSSKAERITQTLDIYNFELEQEDLELISKVGASYKFRGFFDKLFAEFD